MFMYIRDEPQSIPPDWAINYLIKDGFTEPQAKAIVNWMLEIEAEENRLNPPCDWEFDPVLIRTYWEVETLDVMRSLYDFDPAIAAAQTVDEMLKALHDRGVSAVATGEPDTIVHLGVS